MGCSTVWNGEFTSHHAGRDIWSCRLSAQAPASAERAEPLRQDGRPSVSVILPTFNEKDNIVSLVEELRSRFRAADHSYELLVVDDQSPDGTGGIVAAAFAEDPAIRVIVRRANAGLAYSIREGIERSTGSIILVMDTDFNHKPKDAVLLSQVAQYVDLVIGSRFTFGGGMSNLPRYYLSYFYNIFLRLTLGTRLDDNLSGLFAVKRERIFELDFDKIFWGYGDYFFRLLLLSQRAGFLHIEVPIFYGERLGGESKTRFLEIFAKYTREVLYLVVLKALGRW
jgi:dolichol-phosphate mannosyltransferase